MPLFPVGGGFETDDNRKRAPTFPIWDPEGGVVLNVKVLLLVPVGTVWLTITWSVESS